MGFDIKVPEDSDPEVKRRIYVALNQDGVEDLKNLNFESENVKRIEIPYKEFYIFYHSGVMHDVNQECDLLLDAYEEDWLYDRFDQLMSVLKPYKDDFPNMFHAAEMACELETGLSFWF